MNDIGSAADDVARTAREKLDAQLSDAARAIAVWVQKNGGRAVSVKEFVSTGTFPPSTAGVAIREHLLAKLQNEELMRKLLEEKLIQQKLEISPDGPFAVHGSFTGKRDEERSTFAVLITVVVEHKEGQPRLTVPARVFAEEDITALLTANLRLPVTRDEPTNVPLAPTTPAAAEERSQDLEREQKLRADAFASAVTRHREPPLRFEAGSPSGTEQVPSKSEVRILDTPYSIEILVKNDETNGRYVPRAPKMVDGQPFVEIKPGEVYAVRLINDSTEYDAGVTLSIDGLSAFHFSENPEYKKLNKWLIPKQGQGTVTGWHLRNERGKMQVAEFEVTSYGDTPAVKMGNSQQYGTITATFCAAWNKGQAPPPGDLYYERTRGTKQGKTRLEELTEYERYFGKPRASISIRYERPPAVRTPIETTAQR